MTSVLTGEANGSFEFGKRSFKDCQRGVNVYSGKSGEEKRFSCVADKSDKVCIFCEIRKVS